MCLILKCIVIDHTGLFLKRISKTSAAKREPEKAQRIWKIIMSSRSRGTKEHYVSQLRQWIIYCDDFSLDPLRMPPDPHTYIFWIQERIDAVGSIASLEQWTAMMNWLCEIACIKPIYKLHPDVKLYMRAIRKQYTTQRDHRLPFKVKHLLVYIKYLRYKKNKGKAKMDYNDFVKTTIAQVFLFTMSRPSELLKTRRCDGMSSGLELKYVSEMMDREHNKLVMKLTIKAYKNQASKKIAKHIYISSSKCPAERNNIRNKNGEKCPCHYLDPISAIKTMLKMRKKLLSNLRNKLGDEISKKERKEINKTLHTLDLNKNNPLFVFDDGKIASTSTLRQIAKDICMANNILDAHHYTAYSFRIGGTTRASTQGIDHPFILRYVGWSESRLGDCSQRYMRYSNYELSTMIYQMIHGPRNNIGFVGNSHHKNRTYDPWSEMTRFGKYAEK